MSSDWSLCGSQAKIYVFDHLVAVHPASINAFLLAEVRARRTLYGQYLCRAPDWTWNQTFACRDIAGSSSHSEHSHTIACDIRNWDNPMRDDGVLIHDYDRFGVEDGAKFLYAYSQAGFRNGITWTIATEATLRAVLLRKGQKIRDGRVDAMHLECELTPSQVQASAYKAKLTQAKGETVAIGGNDAFWLDFENDQIYQSGLLRETAQALGIDTSDPKYGLAIEITGDMPRETRIDRRQTYHSRLERLISDKIAAL